MSEWLDIRTAPQDGTCVLIASRDEQWVCEAQYLTDEGWWALNNHPTDNWGEELFPTHWQPLPEPPK